jgi:hypothetical protein
MVDQPIMASDIDAMFDPGAQVLPAGAAPTEKP